MTQDPIARIQAALRGDGLARVAGPWVETKAPNVTQEVRVYARHDSAGQALVRIRRTWGRRDRQHRYLVECPWWWDGVTFRHRTGVGYPMPDEGDIVARPDDRPVGAFLSLAGAQRWADDRLRKSGWVLLEPEQLEDPDGTEL